MQARQPLKGLCTSLSENRRFRRFSESEAESPCTSRDACKWNDMHKSTRFSIKKLHGMHVRMQHAPPARNASCARRVNRHVFSRRMSERIDPNCTYEDRKVHCNTCAWLGWRPPPCPNAPKMAHGKEAPGLQNRVKQKFEGNEKIVDERRTDSQPSSLSRSASAPPAMMSQSRHNVQLVNGRSPPHLVPQP